jgi:hypothetical protein
VVFGTMAAVLAALSRSTVSRRVNVSFRADSRKVAMNRGPR